MQKYQCWIFRQYIYNYFTRCFSRLKVLICFNGLTFCIQVYHFEIIISNSSTNSDGWNSHGSKALILSILVTEQVLFCSLLGELFDSLKPRLLWGQILYLLFLGLVDCIKASLKAKLRVFSLAKSMFCETLMGKLGFLLKAKTVFEEQIL